MRMPRFRRGAAPRRHAAADAETVVQGGPPVVEEEELAPPPPPPPPPRPLIWPWLLVLLILVAAGLIALWLVNRDNGHGKSTVRVPDVVHDTQSEAAGRLRQRGLVSRIVTRPSVVPVGTVFAEKPSAGTRVTKGSVITLLVSSTAEVTVPDVTGMQASEAVATLHRKGLSTQTATAVSPKAPGTVLSESPAAGNRVAKGSVVTLRISRGKVRVPNVVGQKTGSASATIRGAGLVPKPVKVPSPQAKGTVVAQAPHGGARLAPGSAVRVERLPRPGRGRRAHRPTASAATTTTAAGERHGPGRERPEPGRRAARAERGRIQGGRRLRLVGRAGGDSRRAVAASGQHGQAWLTGSAQRVTRPEPGRAAAGAERRRASTASRRRRRLRAAGFKVQQLTRTVTNASQSGKVVDEQPSGGRQAPQRLDGDDLRRPADGAVARRRGRRPRRSGRAG